MNRIEMIKSYGQDEEMSKALADITKQIELFKAIAEIEWNWNRAKELIDTANACVQNHIDIPNRFFKGDCGFLAFYVGKHPIIDSLWIGGYSRVYFKDGKLSHSGGEDKIMRFMNDFNEFESDFYAFIDETVQA